MRLFSEKMISVKWVKITIGTMIEGNNIKGKYKIVLLDAQKQIVVAGFGQIEVVRR